MAGEPAPTRSPPSALAELEAERLLVLTESGSPRARSARPQARPPRCRPRPDLPARCPPRTTPSSAATSSPTQTAGVGLLVNCMDLINKDKTTAQGIGEFPYVIIHNPDWTWLRSRCLHEFGRKNVGVSPRTGGGRESTRREGTGRERERTIEEKAG